MNEIQNQVQSLIDSLEHMRKHPFMWISQDKNALANFLNGTEFGCSLSRITIGHTPQDEIFQQVLAEHNLSYSPMNVTHQLEERGCSAEKVIDEALLIHIETLKRRYNISDSAEKQD